MMTVHTVSVFGVGSSVHIIYIPIVAYFWKWAYSGPLIYLRERTSMPSVTIEQRTFERLQNYAKPLVDTPNSVIMRALDALEQAELGLPRGVSKPPRAGGDLLSLDPDDPLPDLTHTRVLAASVAGRPIRANWNNVLRHMLQLAVDEVDSLDEIRRLCAVNIVAGAKEDEGYRHLAEAGISYQGLNANAAAAAALALANGIGVAVELDFEWRRKPEALHPGRRAEVRLSGC